MEAGLKSPTLSRRNLLRGALVGAVVALADTRETIPKYTWEELEFIIGTRTQLADTLGAQERWFMEYRGLVRSALTVTTVPALVPPMRRITRDILVNIKKALYALQALDTALARNKSSRTNAVYHAAVAAKEMTDLACEQVTWFRKELLTKNSDIRSFDLFARGKRLET